LETVPEPKLVTYATEPSGLNATVRGSMPTETSPSLTNPVGSTILTELLSGFTAARRSPEGENDTADADVDLIGAVPGPMSLDSWVGEGAGGTGVCVA
jgi:hypothetical protein